MDVPEISTLRDDEDSPPPDAHSLSFSKFRVNLCAPAPRSASSKASGDVVGPPVGPSRRMWLSPAPPDSDDDDEEDQLIDDDELAIVTETGHGPISSPATFGSPSSTPSPRKRGSATRGRQRRGGISGRRGRPGREPPDAAAMMNTFELNKPDQAAGPSTAVRAGSPSSMPPVSAPPPQAAVPSTGDWSSATPPKPPRKKPGPKKGSTIGPRGPRKGAAKNAHLSSGVGTPVLEDMLLAPDSSSFLVPAAPSIPPTPGSDQPPLPSLLPPITAPDLALDPTIPVPVYPLPTRSFPVQPPPKVLAGYAATHPLDPHSGPPRSWKVVQREVKGVAGGRWFARTWLGEKDKGAPGPVILGPPPSTPPVRAPSSAREPLPPLPPPAIPSHGRRGARSGTTLRRQRDTSSEPESQRSRSPVGTNESLEPGEGLPRIPS